MYTGLLHIHNLLRWLILVSALVAVFNSYIGWIGKKGWGKRDSFFGLILTIFTDLQLVTGIALYFFYSPILKSAFNDFGAAMKNSDLRFYAVEHILLMFIAIIVIHIGHSKSKTAVTPVKQHKIAAIFYTIGLILILTAIPWNRALI